MLQTDIETDALNTPRRFETKQAGGVAADRLRSIVERIERLESERKALGDDIKHVYAEAVSAGFDKKVLRQIVAARGKDPAELSSPRCLTFTPQPWGCRRWRHRGRQ